MIIPHAPNKVEPVKIPNNTHIIDKSIFDEYIFGEGVCLIEWANLIEEILPEQIIEITIEKNLEKGFDYRKITVTGLPEQIKWQKN